VTLPGLVREDAATGLPWSTEQRVVIDLPDSARVLVHAGPGTGKTAVALARVSRLVAAGMDAHQILIISFTRTAVAELRTRIQGMSPDNADAVGVQIATIDSKMWQVRRGFEAEAVQKSSREVDFESNLERMQDLLDGKDSGAREYLQGLQHIVVDEAQDVVGTRAQLLLSILRLLPSTCGITVFGDPDQAIYGFSEDSANRATSAPEDDFLSAFADSDLCQDVLELSHIFRAGGATVEALFLAARQHLGGRNDSSQTRCVRMQEAIQAHSRHIERWTPDEVAGDRDALVLFRTRVEVLQSAAMLASKGHSFRMRLGGMGEVAHPWVASLLGDFPEPLLSKATFLERWAALQHHAFFTGLVPDKSWDSLRSVAGSRGFVSIALLRQKLLRTRPPPELAQEACGGQGPTLSTIHASKGREAPKVHLALMSAGSTVVDSAVDWDEESRVWYVAATRTQESLTTHSAGRMHATSLDDGRVYRRTKDGDYQVQIGIRGDVDPISSALGKRAAAAQAFMLRSGYGPVSLTARATEATTWKYELIDSAGTFVGRLSSSFQAAAWTMARQVAGRYRPQAEFRYVWYLGACSSACPTEQLTFLHPNFQASGIFLSPVVAAFTKHFDGPRKA